MSTLADIYGPVIDSGTIEDAVEATLDLWMDQHLAVQEERLNMTRGELLRPRGLITLSEIDIDRLDEQLPGLIVRSPGEGAPPSKNQRGEYRQTWRIEVAAVVRANTERQARRRAGIYLAAIKSVIVKNRTLGDRVEQAIWIGGDNHAARSLPNDEQLAVFATACNVTVAVAVNTTGPDQPAPDPYDPVPLPSGPSEFNVTVEVDPIP